MVVIFYHRNVLAIILKFQHFIYIGDEISSHVSWSTCTMWVNVVTNWYLRMYLMIPKLQIMWLPSVRFRLIITSTPLSGQTLNMDGTSLSKPHTGQVNDSCTHTHTHTHTWACTHACTRTHTHAHKHAYMHACTHPPPLHLHNMQYTYIAGWWWVVSGPGWDFHGRFLHTL